MSGIAGANDYLQRFLFSLHYSMYQDLRASRSTPFRQRLHLLVADQASLSSGWLIFRPELT
jgi:hypothetical protein